MHVDRLGFLLDGLNNKSGGGIEVGPYFNPLAPKALGWKTTVIDYAPSGILRENFKKMAAESGREDIKPMISNIEEVDLVWRGQKFVDLVEDNGLAKCNQYFLSSHNIEHVTDVIDYLKAVELCLSSNGVAAMAIPDLRYTFDFFRRPSTLADALHARDLGTINHPLAHWLDHALNSLDNNGQGCWTTESPLGTLLFSNDPFACFNEYLSLTREDEKHYKDCHRWVFTPASFELLLFDLNWTGLCGLTIKQIASAENGVLGSEFLVRLTAAEIRQYSREEIVSERLRLQLAIQSQLASVMTYPAYRS